MVGPGVIFKFNVNERDGLDINFYRVSASALVETETEECFSLATFIGAIRTFQGKYSCEEGQSMELLGQGLLQYGQGLITGDADLYRKVGELRFWHVGHWTQEWGRAILMTPAEIEYQKSLVPEIMRLASKCRLTIVRADAP